RAVAPASADQWDGLRQTVAALDAGHGGGTDGPCLDVARSVVVSCAPLAAAGGGGGTQGGGGAARGGGRDRRCTPTRPAVRASPGMKGPRGCHASPLVQAFLPLWRSTGEPAIFIRSGQVHGLAVLRHTANRPAPRVQATYQGVHPCWAALAP